MPEAVTEKVMPPITMVPLKDILIPADRQRQALNDIKLGELATSIQAHGLMNPIVLCPVDVARFPGAKQPFQLVAGYRRYLAHVKLKRMQIPATMREDITDRLEQEEMELDENLMRENLPWQDEVAAKKRIYEIRKVKYGEGTREVAEHVGDSKGEFWEDMRLAKAMDTIPGLSDSKNKSQAQNKLRLLARRFELTQKAEALTKNLPKIDPQQEILHKVKLGDCLQIVRDWADGCLRCVITDPPYGINLHIGDTKKGSPHPTIYDDDTYDIMDHTALMFKEAYRLLGDNTHAYFFFDIKQYAKVFHMLSDTGFIVEPIPLLWVKPGPGQVNHPDSRWGSGYEACFFCRKGHRALLRQGQSNVLTHDPVPANRKTHPVEKPVALLRQLIETSTAPGETIADFYAGSGSLGEAAIQTGRNFLLCEKDSAYHAGIIERLAKLAGSTEVVAGAPSNKYDPLGGAEEED
jgi:site-specific DNA-methyltransferase (adenine-specific)